MSAEETTSASEPPLSDEPLHRPLPSVGMPLLRDQRRDARAKQLALVAAGLVLVAAGIGAFAIFGSTSADADPTDDPVASAAAETPEDTTAGDGDGGTPTAPEGASAPTPTAVPAPSALSEDEQPTALGAVTRSVNAFGAGRGFRAAMQAAGANDEEYAELETALTGLLDFRRCQPTDRLVFERDTDGNIVLFEYRGAGIDYYQVTRNRRGEFRGEKVQVPVEARRIARGGRIRSSLGAAFEEAGLGRALVGRFMEALEGKVNFNSHARTGDTFRVIADEERVNGEFHGWGTVHAVEYIGSRAGELRAFYFELPGEDDGQFYEEDGRAIRGGWLRTPLHYDRISSRYDPRRMHPILRRLKPHNGVDYAAGTGTPVWATADGTVTFAGERGANGNLVAIRHANGYESFYAHLSRFASGLSRGDTVEQRQLIGYVGSTGRSTGPHLHFGLKRNGNFVDPLEEINGPGRMMPRGPRGRFRPLAQRLKRELAAIEVSGTTTAATGTPEATDDGGDDETEVPMD